MCSANRRVIEKSAWPFFWHTANFGDSMLNHGHGPGPIESARTAIRTAFLILTLFGVSPLQAQNGDREGEVQALLPADFAVPPAPPLSAEESLGTFRLPPGFRIEIVAAEPLVETPVAMQFDPNGRLWVVEMRGYMPNPDGIGETNEVGRVVVLEDRNGDGRMDHRTVFLDRLVMPRALSLIGDGLLVAEPPRLWFCRDTNGDGVADDRIEVTNDYATQNDPRQGKNSNPEHASNGLMLAMDNWIYSLYHPWRYRRVNGVWQREPSINRGQWGISQDDFGRLFFNSNSDQLRGDLVPDRYLERNPNYKAAGANVRIATDQSVFPIRVTPGVNRGYQPGLLKDGKLTIFTAACGPVVYRGDNFPPEYHGNAFVAEPSANLIHRNVLLERDGIVTATNGFEALEKTSFLASADERFRPVNLYNGPDGGLYIVDIRRGIIQHRIYMTTFLRRQVEARGLDRPTDQGRIYRVVHEAQSRPAAPRLAPAGNRELIAALSHPNGWWRDTAQRLLVERADARTHAPLRHLAAHAADPRARLHALWTLEGLGGLNEATVRQAFRDPHPKVRLAAVRLSETFIRPGGGLHRSPDFLRLLDDPAAEVRWQVALTLGELKQDDALAQVVERSLDHPYIRAAALSSLGGRELEFAERLLATDSWREQTKERAEFLAALAAAVFTERRVDRVDRLFALAGKQTEDNWRQTALLDGALGTLPPPPRGRPQPKPAPARLESEPKSLAALAEHSTGAAREKAAQLLALVTWPGRVMPAAEAVVPLTAEQQQRFESGRELYAVTCGTCHQAHGNGQEGLAPPLRDTEWTTGPASRLVRIALHGVRGPIQVKGRTYELEMPGMGVLDDDSLAAILTYLRREWGHTASPVDPEDVAKIRADTSERIDAWTEAELMKLE